MRKKLIGFILMATGALLFGMAFVVGNLEETGALGWSLVYWGIILFAIGLVYLIVLFLLKIRDTINNSI